MRLQLKLELVVEGDLGRVLRYRRPSGRCPVADFLDGLDKNSRNKLKGEFEAVTLRGRNHENHQRFKALTGKGKPLWEFKEFDHRVYCSRECRPDSEWVEVVLLYGWTKQKRGKHKEEDNEIENAQRLYDEYLEEKERMKK